MVFPPSYYCDPPDPEDGPDDNEREAADVKQRREETVRARDVQWSQQNVLHHSALAAKCTCEDVTDERKGQIGPWHADICPNEAPF